MLASSLADRYARVIMGSISKASYTIDMQSIVTIAGTYLILNEELDALNWGSSSLGYGGRDTAHCNRWSVPFSTLRSGHDIGRKSSAMVTSHWEPSMCDISVQRTKKVDNEALRKDELAKSTSSVQPKRSSMKSRMPTASRANHRR